LIQAPNVAVHPFDLPIVDHCSHFHIETLLNTLALAEFEVVKYSDKWVNKELGLIARTQNDDKSNMRESNCRVQEDKPDSFEQSKEYLCNGLDYMKKLIAHASKVAKKNGMGMLGVAIDGTYIGEQILEDLDFFVDENPFYEGKKHMGKPIFSMMDIPVNSSVYLPFSYDVALSIQERFKEQYPEVNCILPLQREDSVTCT